MSYRIIDPYVNRPVGELYVHRGGAIGSRLKSERLL